MKSFYVLQVPFVLYKKNIEYASSDNQIKFNGKSKLLTHASVKFSRPKSPQMELGNTSQSEETFGCFRDIFYEGDCLIILKIKGEIKYEGYIIKKKDADIYNLDNYISLNPSKNSYSTVRIDSFNKIYNIVDSRNIIYHGAPGTGKSYQLDKDAEVFGKNKKRVTFHSNMMYSNFIGTYKPVPTQNSDNPITYDFIAGPMLKSIVSALLKPEEPHLLIIEEINRANVAAVFGDTFQLLDRNKNGESLYPIDISEDIRMYLNKEIYLNDSISEKIKEDVELKLNDGLIFPANLYLWATMNNADQGIMTPLDTAFKRRWDFKYFGIDNAYNHNDFEKYGDINLGYNKTISWNSMRQFINDNLSLLNIPEDKLLGPYFLSKNILQKSNEEVTKAFIDKVIMYLFQDLGAHNRTKIFNVETMRYSSIIDEFYEHGEKIFNNYEEIENKIVKHEFASNTNDSE